MSDPYQPYQPYSQPGQQPAPQAGEQQAPQPGYPQPGYPQPGYPQPPQGQYPPQGYPYPAYAPEPPGRTMGIVGFVLAFVVAPAGIVVSAMALSESKRAGVDNPLGRWGLWLSIIFSSLAVLYAVFMGLVVFGGMLSFFSVTTSTLDGAGMSV
ncbi:MULTISPECIES: hypothetical protein [unclassified Isoptericola]|uniref:hypothetical protein n=1 Tax=unclassified Isoptericola TaxID=2623355 RepID=UPI00364E14DC